MANAGLLKEESAQGARGISFGDEKTVDMTHARRTAGTRSRRQTQAAQPKRFPYCCPEKQKRLQNGTSSA
jgi:hypothetical protein